MRWWFGTPGGKKGSEEVSWSSSEKNFGRIRETHTGWLDQGSRNVRRVWNGERSEESRSSIINEWGMNQNHVQQSRGSFVYNSVEAREDVIGQLEGEREKISIYFSLSISLELRYSGSWFLLLLLTFSSPFSTISYFIFSSLTRASLSTFWCILHSNPNIREMALEVEEFHT